MLALAAALLPWGNPGEPRAPWREVRYAGRTSYRIVAAGAEAILSEESRDQNSALLQETRLDPRGVTLRWRWRVLEHPMGADPGVRAQDDRAAAVLVIVRRSLLPWRTSALMYQWTLARPRGEWSRSPYSQQVRTLVLENASADSAWREESRDLAADLELAFGRLPTRIEAIGVICDTDNTGARARAEFGEIRVERPQIRDDPGTWADER